MSDENAKDDQVVEEQSAEDKAKDQAPEQGEDLKKRAGGVCKDAVDGLKKTWRSGTKGKVAVVAGAVLLLWIVSCLFSGGGSSKLDIDERTRLLGKRVAYLDARARDILSSLGSISRDEMKYYLKEAESDQKNGAVDEELANCFEVREAIEKRLGKTK